MIQVSVIGATGYAGIELVRLLANHPEVQIKHLVSHSFSGKSLGAVYPSFQGTPLSGAVLEDLDVPALAVDSDCVFTSLPHGAGGDVIAQLFAQGKVVIDLSGDYRYDSAAVYEQWYGVPHPHPELLSQSVYGLPELHKNAIRNARLIGNPGCYTTCSILALAPLVKGRLIDPKSIIIDAKSGSTGAGRSVSQAMHFCEVNESAKAYKVATHRHTSEIEQELSLLAEQPLAVSFTPHLLPINRGILATSYASLAAPVSDAEINACYREFYRDQPFVVIHDPGSLPEIKFAVGSNRIHIGSVADRRTGRIVVISCLDNLIKGAAGQAVQNMNLAFGLDETCALTAPAWYL